MSGSCRAAMNSSEAPPKGPETTCQSSEAQSSLSSGSVARSRASPTFVAYKRRAAALMSPPRDPKSCNRTPRETPACFCTSSVVVAV